MVRGEVVGLGGVAGAGHHTVLELVSGLRRPDRGTVVLPSGATVPHGLRASGRRAAARPMVPMFIRMLFEPCGVMIAFGDALIRSTAEAGAPVLICSTDIDELAALCDRVVVLRRGRAVAELAGETLRTHAVLEAMNS